MCAGTNRNSRKSFQDTFCEFKEVIMTCGLFLSLPRLRYARVSEMTTEGVYVCTLPFVHVFECGCVCVCVSLEEESGQ